MLYSSLGQEKDKGKSKELIYARFPIAKTLKTAKVPYSGTSKKTQHTPESQSQKSPKTVTTVVKIAELYPGEISNEMLR